jgi:hypothetical protein
MEARLQGDDLVGVEEGLRDYAQLPPREQFADQLAKFKEQATRQQAESKMPVLTPNIQAQFNELQALIDRYLDDEALTTYTEALERKRAEKAATAEANEKAAARRKLAAARAPADPSPPANTPSSGPKQKALAKPGDPPF